MTSSNQITMSNLLNCSRLYSISRVIVLTGLIVIQFPGKFKFSKLIFTILFFYFLSTLVFAEDKNNLLILNSNQSVLKYSLTEKVFLDNQDQSATVYNLADPNFDQTKLQTLISNSDFNTVYCIGSKAYLLALKIASDKNLVFSSAINWRRLPMTDQSYGVSQELSTDMQLTTYRYLFPGLKNIGVIYSSQFNNEWIDKARDSAEDVGINIVASDISKSQNLTNTIQSLLTRVDVLWLIADPLVLKNKASVIEIFKQAKSYKKPIFGYSKTFINLGASLVISADVPTVGRQVSMLVDKLRQKDPIKQRVKSPIGSNIILNMGALKNYSIKLNKEALGSVNHIIE